jgi:hypothetical protein
VYHASSTQNIVLQTTCLQYLVFCSRLWIISTPAGPMQYLPLTHTSGSRVRGQQVLLTKLQTSTNLDKVTRIRCWCPYSFLSPPITPYGHQSYTQETLAISRPSGNPLSVVFMIPGPVPPMADGSCPVEYPVKLIERSLLSPLTRLTNTLNTFGGRLVM